MNWKEIKNKHPKSFKVLNDWEGIKADPNRFLYDFFDEQEIICLITEHGYYLLDFTGDLVYISESMKQYNTRVIFQDYSHNYCILNFNRGELEDLMFTKAFEILENNLK